MAGYLVNKKPYEGMISVPRPPATAFHYRNKIQHYGPECKQHLTRPLFQTPRRMIPLVADVVGVALKQDPVAALPVRRSLISALRSEVVIFVSLCVFSVPIPAARHVPNDSREGGKQLLYYFAQTSSVYCGAVRGCTRV